MTWQPTLSLTHQWYYHIRYQRQPPVDASYKERTIFSRKTKRKGEKVRDRLWERGQRESRKRRRRGAQTPGVPTSLPLGPASKTPPCHHPGEIAAWEGQPRFPAAATSAPGPGWPSQDRNVMPTGSSFYPARVYCILRASFSHSGDAFASFRAPRVSGAPVFRSQVFRARVPRALSWKCPSVPLIELPFPRVNVSSLLRFKIPRRSLLIVSRKFPCLRIWETIPSRLFVGCMQVSRRRIRVIVRRV